MQRKYFLANQRLVIQPVFLMETLTKIIQISALFSVRSTVLLQVWIMTLIFSGIKRHKEETKDILSGKTMIHCLTSLVYRTLDGDASNLRQITSHLNGKTNDFPQHVQA